MSDLAHDLQRTLDPHYRIVRELGGGGMSQVFLAVEVALDREVVIKVLPPSLAVGVSTDRFRREMQMVAKLQHPHIVPVLTSGTAGELLYYIMPFIKGESLRARLQRDVAMPVEESARLLREVADALSFAHAQGVVHRDIKPDNVLLSSGHAMVTDFGVAKALGVGDPGHDGGLTSVGIALGTPVYMAPEQAMADPHVDHRADLYALGVMAYEMLAGQPPFVAPTAQALIAAHMTRAPESLRLARSTVPEIFDDLVQRLLAKRREDRVQHAAELLPVLDRLSISGGSLSSATPDTTSRAMPGPLRDLRSLAAPVGGALLILAAAFGAIAYGRLHSGDTQRPIVAVLPFENLGAPSDSYFADGLTDEVRARLTGISGLQVIGGRSASQYKNTSKSSREIGRELGASHLLTGSVRWERTPDGRGRVRVTPELIRVADQQNLWAEPIDGSFDEVFSMQARVAERVASALDVKLLVGEGREVEARPTTNLAAYDAYLRGRASISAATRFSAADRQATLKEFTRAVALDPTFVAAYAEIAWVHFGDYSEAGDAAAAAAALAKFRAAAERAWALDSSLVDTRLVRARYLELEGDWASADRLVRATARTAPGNVDVIASLAGVERRNGRPDEAIAAYRRAMALDPRAENAWNGLAGLLDRLHRYEEAIAVREQQIAITPNAEVAYAVQASSHLLWRGDTAAARHTLERGSVTLPWVVRFPGGIAGISIWQQLLPPAVLRARDTLTLAGYLAGAGGIAPELYHLVKLRHFMHSGDIARARAHADSLVARIEPTVRSVGDEPWFFWWFSRRSVLAEAYAMLGRNAEAARVTDDYVAETRRQRADRPGTEALCHALHNAAYVDVLVGRKDVAISLLTEALALPCGHRVSRALLRVDPVWAPLRGHATFDQLLK